MTDQVLTSEEKSAIASLKRLAKRWPNTLTLFSWSGSLVVFRTGEERSNETVLDSIEGIPNDGGDP